MGGGGGGGRGLGSNSGGEKQPENTIQATITAQDILLECNRRHVPEQREFAAGLMRKARPCWMLERSDLRELIGHGSYAPSP